MFEVRKIENPYGYLQSLSPAEFDRYRARPSKKGQIPTNRQIDRLTAFLRLLPHDKNMLVYIWRFVLFMDTKIINQYSGVEYAHGVSEALRFTCKRHIEYAYTLSDHAMHRAFAPLLPDFEILLVSRQAGICWHQNKMIDPGLIQDVIEITEKRKDRENE